MSESKNKESLARYFLRASPVILVIAAIMSVLAYFGLLHDWEMRGLDPLLRFSAPAKDSHIVIVEITDDDYEHWFGDRSPLDRSVIKDLIKTVELGQPALVVVDLDLSDSPAIPENFKLNNIIWAQVTDRLRAPKEEPQLKKLPQIDHGHLALPLFPRDRDGAVRSYLRRVKVKDADGNCFFWPTMPWAAHEQGAEQPESCDSKDEEEELFFNFGGDRYSFDRTDVASILGDRLAAGHFVPQDPERLKTLLSNKTVLIGGNFAAARDEYFTPAGPIPGVDLIAYALETENRHAGIQPIKEILVIVLDVVLGFLIVSYSYYYSLRKALVLGMLSGALLPVLFSYLVFHTANFWLSFVPVALGALVHIVWDGIHDLLKEHEELGGLARENEALQEENSRQLEQIEQLTRLAETPLPIVEVNVNVEEQPER